MHACATPCKRSYYLARETVMANDVVIGKRKVKGDDGKEEEEVLIKKVIEMPQVRDPSGAWG